MQAPADRRRPGPPDQAHGLRQLFAANERRVLALAHNPFVAFGGVAMERLAAGLAERGLHTLVVDAADTASTPHELAGVDLAACVEPLSSRVSYLAARGLPKRWIDSRGGAGGFIEALLASAPQADVVIVHAGASDLRRLFMGRVLCPMVLAGAHAESLTHAYGAIKLLAQRGGMAAYDLLAVQETATARGRRAAERLAERLADCGERFLAVAMRGWAVVDPASDVADQSSAALTDLLAVQLSTPQWPLHPAPPSSAPPAAALYGKPHPVIGRQT